MAESDWNNKLDVIANAIILRETRGHELVFSSLKNIIENSLFNVVEVVPVRGAEKTSRRPRVTL